MREIMRDFFKRFVTGFLVGGGAMALLEALVKAINK